MLFYLQRDPNINTLIYAVNLKSNGEVNTSQPITSYWIRYAEKGQRKELGYIQRKFAYGVTSREISKNKYEFRFVSRKSMPFYLVKTKSGQYEVSVTVNGKTIIVRRIFIRIEGGSFWLPNVKYTLMIGEDERTRKPAAERIEVN